MCFWMFHVRFFFYSMGFLEISGLFAFLFCMCFLEV